MQGSQNNYSYLSLQPSKITLLQTPYPQIPGSNQTYQARLVSGAYYDQNQYEVIDDAYELKNNQYSILQKYTFFKK